MYNLISANLAKMRKSLCFKIYIAFAFLYSLSNIVLHFIEIRSVLASADLNSAPENLSPDLTAQISRNFYTDSIMFDAAITMIFAALVFTGIFIGREYGDGGLRNKLIAGHSRGTVYLANLTVCVIANVTAMLLAIGTVLAVGIPIMGTNFTPEYIALCIAFMIAANIALTSLFVFGSMIISSKAVSCVTLILSFMALFFITVYIEGKLDAPEYYPDYAMTIDESGTQHIEKLRSTKNPYYISGTQRKIYEFLDENLPVSQLYHMASDGEAPASAFPLAADAAVLVFFAGVGILVFKRKNIK